MARAVCAELKEKELFSARKNKMTEGVIHRTVHLL